MRNYVSVSLFIIVIQLVIFGIVEAMAIPILTDPFSAIDNTTSVIAAIGVGLLTADVILPIPSSLVMVGHGALLGIIPGAILSIIGTIGASLIGFGIGRLSTSTLEKFIKPDEQQRGEQLLSRYGWVAIALTRPVPILAETTIIIAGTTRMKWSTMLVASLCGNVPIAIIYAITGATAADLNNFLIIFAVIIAVTGSLWIINRQIMKQSQVGEHNRD